MKKHDAAMHAFRCGFAPQFSPASLERLADALRRNSRQVVQMSPVHPRGTSVRDFAGCAVGFMVLEHAETPTEAWDLFAGACQECDRRLGRNAACNDFLGWFDRQPRRVAFPALLAEIEAILGCKN